MKRAKREPVGFPLADWFDLSKKISWEMEGNAAAELTEIITGGGGLEFVHPKKRKELSQALHDMDAAIKAHNLKIALAKGAAKQARREARIAEAADTAYSTGGPKESNDAGDRK
jgi:hypothetical protein